MNYYAVFFLGLSIVVGAMQGMEYPPSHPITFTRIRQKKYEKFLEKVKSLPTSEEADRVRSMRAGGQSLQEIIHRIHDKQETMQILATRTFARVGTAYTFSYESLGIGRKLYEASSVVSQSENEKIPNEKWYAEYMQKLNDQSNCLILLEKEIDDECTNMRRILSKWRGQSCLIL